MPQLRTRDYRGRGARGRFIVGGAARVVLAALVVRRASIAALRDATAGEYEILSELGRGGMATVYLAHDIALHRKVAIKVISPHLFADNTAERFLREARTAAALNHPNLIPIYSVRQTETLLFFVMKFVAGPTLETLINEGKPLPIPVVQAILSETASALGYAHRRQIVHRDVKPGNIMLDEEGRVVVTDFGIARNSESTGLTGTGMSVGTPMYMSPEQCLGEAVNGASDQYSLGIVGYQLLTGKIPFEASTPVAMMYAHMHTSPQPLAEARPDCPPALAAAIMRMIAKTAADRGPTIEEANRQIGAPPLAADDPAAHARGGARERRLGQSVERFCRARRAVRSRPRATRRAGRRAPGSAADARQHQGRGSGRRAAAHRAVAGHIRVGVGETEAWMDAAGGPCSRRGCSWRDCGRPQCADAGERPRRRVACAGARRAGERAAGCAAGGQSRRRLARSRRPHCAPARHGRCARGDRDLAHGVGGPRGRARAAPRAGARCVRARRGRCARRGLELQRDAKVALVTGGGMIEGIVGGTRGDHGDDRGERVVHVGDGRAPHPRPRRSRHRRGRVEIIPSTLTIVRNTTGQMPARLHDGTGKVLADRAVRWSSANPQVADVSTNGLVIGVGPGTTQITASAEGRSASATVLVPPGAAALGVGAAAHRGRARARRAHRSAPFDPGIRLELVAAIQARNVTKMIAVYPTLSPSSRALWDKLFDDYPEVVATLVPGVGGHSPLSGESAAFDVSIDAHERARAPEDPDAFPREPRAGRRARGVSARSCRAT